MSRKMLDKGKKDLKNVNNDGHYCYRFVSTMGIVLVLRTGRYQVPSGQTKH